jgi:hypothetical protein
LLAAEEEHDFRHVSIDRATVESSDEGDVGENVGDDDSRAAALPNNSERRTTVSALAWAPTTPILATILIPLLIFASHGLFWYGQRQNMWKVTEQFSANVTWTVTGREAKIAWSALGLPLTDSYEKDESKDVRTFTYAYAIRELWAARGMPGVFLPRLAAVLLIIFSGLWPHLKLIMLHVTWWTARNPVRRKRALNSLGVLGKWSLCDVLVVCVMVGVLHLQWDWTAEQIKEGISQNIETVAEWLHTLYTSESLCSEALKFDCHDPHNLIHKMECRTCREFMHTFWAHPDKVAHPVLKGITVSGGGCASLFVAGLRGIYAFCGAVILSILLSCIVDWFELKAAAATALSNQSDIYQPLLPEEHSDDTTPEITGTLSQDGEPPVLLLQQEDVLRRLEQGRRVTEHRSEADMAYDQLMMESVLYKPNWPMRFTAIATAVVAFLAASLPTMERRVAGAYPDTVHEILGVEWTQRYSFWSLARTTAVAGGWDWMLFSTFALFMIAGPLLRGLLSVQTLWMNVRGRTDIAQYKKRLSTFIDFIGAFCAWEVFAMAVIMVDLLMPSITSTIIHDKR